MRYKLSEIAQICDGRLEGPDTEIAELVVDTRRILVPKTSLYIALKGPRFDGHDFIQAAIGSGVRSFLIDKNDKDYANGSYVIVTSTLKALQRLAAHHRARFDYPVIAITGSSAKTTLKELIRHALKSDFNIVSSPRSYNSQTGVPLSVVGMDEQHELGVFEAGISQSGEMSSLAEILRPDIGILTVIGNAHQEGFDSVEEKIREKLLLFSESKILIYCSDDPQVKTQVCDAFKEKEIQIMDWGKNESAFLHVIEMKPISTDKTKITYCTDGGTHDTEIYSRSEHDVYNRLHLLALMHALGMTTEATHQAVSRPTSFQAQTELMRTESGTALISDADPIDGPSVKLGLEQLISQGFGATKLIILLDDSDSVIANEETLSTLIQSLHSDHVPMEVWCWGRALHSLSKALGDSCRYFEDPEELLNSIDKLKPLSSDVLLKGPWSAELAITRSHLEGQSHQTYVEIDLEALVHNLNRYRNRLNPGTRVMAMVKAFSYGSGDLEVARVLEFNKVDYLAVAYPDEGATLRRKGIEAPIMVMNTSIEEFSLLMRHRLEPEIYSLRLLRAFDDYLKRNDVRDYPVHLKIDTGMHRLGISEDEIDDVLTVLNASGGIKVRSVFTHLFASDDQAKDERTIAQFVVFERIQKRFLSLSPTPMYHVLNSAGITRFADHQYDMVRLGIGLYGYTVDEEMMKELNTVVSWKSMISQIKQVPKGETVGYGGEYEAEQDLTIATIPVGYADGIPRVSGNGNGSVLIAGIKCPFIGNICMDMSMVDISGRSFSEGQEVVILGSGKSIQDVAHERNTIPYEVLTSIPPRVKRRYVNG